MNVEGGDGETEEDILDDYFGQYGDEDDFTLNDISSVIELEDYMDIVKLWGIDESTEMNKIKIEMLGSIMLEENIDDMWSNYIGLITFDKDNEDKREIILNLIKASIYIEGGNITEGNNYVDLAFLEAKKLLLDSLVEQIEEIRNK